MLGPDPSSAPSSEPTGAEHDGDGGPGVVERLRGGGLLQLHRPAGAGEASAPS